MTLRSRLKGLAIGAFVGTPGQAVRDAAATAARVLRRQARRVDFFHDPADPWSYLTAQAVARLADRYPVEWAILIVSAPASDVDAQPALRARHGVRDASELAAFYDVEFPGKKPPDPSGLKKVCQVLIRDRPFADQLAAAIALGDAMWRNDQKALDALMGQYGHEAAGAIAPILASNYAALRERGHYQGAMLAFGADWYWGIDRLPYLERELGAELGVSAAPAVTPRAEARAPARLVATDRVPLELWFSFRSPYAYLALDRIAELCERYPIDLTLRPVLPMVERGIPAPTIKRLYIVRDAKREADRLGIPFGTLADPLGAGVEHCMAIARHAIARGQGLAFLRSAARGIWAEARDVADYVDLRFVVERAGLDWDEARAAIADDGWKAWASTAAADLETIGLWGVPSYRAGEWTGWGQDRLPMLEDRLRRHVAAVAAGAAAAGAAGEEPAATV